MKYQGQRALIVGVAKSGLAAARFLCEQGADVIATDLKDAEQLEEASRILASLNVFCEFGGYNRHTFLASDLIVLSPGVNPDSALIREAQHHGIEIVNEPELAFREIKVPVIAITGSNGKTTTTHLVGEILKASGLRVFVGGNIGTPLLNFVFDHGKADVIVAELSSYQIELVRSLRPACAVFTNISPNHLDRYKTLDRYVEAKRQLRSLCSAQSIVVLNEDDPIVAQFAAGPHREVRTFSDNGKSSWIMGRPNEVEISGSERFKLSAFQLPGRHNVQNLMAAIAATWKVLPNLTATRSGIQNVIAHFKAVPHRIELVREWQQIRFYNDSKSTTVQSLLTCLAGFEEGRTVALIGGRDKGSSYAPLVPVINLKCRAVILFGEARSLIEAQIGSNLAIPFKSVKDVQAALTAALDEAQPGDTVVLSPACASQDAFNNFEERGDYFKSLVRALK